MTIEVDYRFPPGVDAEERARSIAVGQTIGKWSTRYDARADVLGAHLGVVTGVRAQADGRSVATVRYPRANVEGELATLLSMVFGEYSMAGPAKVVDVRLPEDYGARPTFGIRGLRERTGVHDRPLAMTIFKPALGLTAREHAELLAEVARGGIDVVKDDEIHGDLERAPTLERLDACREVVEEVRRETGREVLYAINVTGRADRMLERARELVDRGANALLVNALPHGLSVLEALATEPRIDVPILAHPALAGALCGAPDHGFAYPVMLGKLFARTGADAVLFPSSRGGLAIEREEEHAIRDALRERDVLPVPAAGIHAGLVPEIVRDYGVDVIVNAGSAVVNHASGPAVGAAELVRAIELAAEER